MNEKMSVIELNAILYGLNVSTCGSSTSMLLKRVRQFKIVNSHYSLLYRGVLYDAELYDAENRNN